MEKIKKGLTGLLWVVFFAFAISMTILLLNRNEYGVTQFDETSLILIKGNLTSEKYKKGDLVLVDKVTLNNIKLGDELFVYHLGEKGAVNIELGKVGQIHLEEKAFTFENGGTYSIELSIGKSAKIHDNLGMFLSIVLSRWGFLFTVLVPSLFIFIYQIYALVIELKYGGEDNVLNN